MSRRKKRDEEEREKHIERRREAIFAPRGSPRKRRPPEQGRPRRDRGREREERVSSRSRDSSTTEERSSTEMDAKESRLSSLRSSVSSVMREADGVQDRISDIDDSIGDLPNRVSKIRRMNYSLMGHLEESQDSLAGRWSSRGPALREDARGRLDTIRSELQSLSSSLSFLGADSDLSSAESRLGSLRGAVSSLSSFVHDELNEFEDSYRDLDSDLSVAENTVDLLSEPSFEWKMREHPVVSIRAHHLEDDVHGILTLTNLRFIFEGEKEVVLKRTLFIATEKKTVREPIIDEPIGAVESIERGKVGLLKGTGLYVKFDPQTGLEEARFDTRGDEGDEVIRLFEYIDSGEAERDLDAFHGNEEGGEGESRPVVCPVCGAPYTEEVFRGQTSVECKYCGTAIHLDA